ncbi:hypothetical protein JIX56_13255 [Streptomyces sp. CA-210063]|uniref:hypothetical protein n=1 Tax=Streptomyces sp. CA-210063 TaxID=2801029 RepID=UPI00214BE652|nr:hypothetical protein [Streptomyces sp. CA-210063]UUU30797.1 hypothetical protein JIX56_13255 [Streptomyces sp. CA-210063]
MTALRLLPWPSPDGNPCFLSTGSGRGVVSRLADDMEAVQLTTGTDVLELGRGVLNDPKATAAELRYTGVRLAECLRDALRVAESRGMRLPGSATEDQDHGEGEEGLG